MKSDRIGGAAFREMWEMVGTLGAELFVAAAQKDAWVSFGECAVLKKIRRYRSCLDGKLRKSRPGKKRRCD